MCSGKCGIQIVFRIGNIVFHTCNVLKFLKCRYSAMRAIYRSVFSAVCFLISYWPPLPKNWLSPLVYRYLIKTLQKPLKSYLSMLVSQLQALSYLV